MSDGDYYGLAAEVQARSDLRDCGEEIPTVEEEDVVVETMEGTIFRRLRGLGL